MNQLGIKDSSVVIFTSIRALSGNIILIGTKSKLIFNLFRSSIFFNLKYSRQFVQSGLDAKCSWKPFV